MRIFYASHDQGNHTPQSKTWYNNLYLPLCDLANDVIRFDYNLFPIAMHQDFLNLNNLEIIGKERPKIDRELIRQITIAHKIKPIDMFFSYFASSYCSEDTIRAIGDMGITTVNWFCNASYQFHLVKDIAPAYHYCLVPEKFRLIDYKSIGANPVYCQEAANPNIYKPYQVSKSYDVSFIGGRYADRYYYIQSLYEAGIFVKVWGENWKRERDKLKELMRPVYNILAGKSSMPDELFGNYLLDEEMVKTYSETKINLGFAICGDTHLSEIPIKQVRLRDFEVPMSGGFYLTEWVDELTDFFEPDREIVCFQTKEECIDKSKYYLEHENERERIRIAGYNRAINEHTWQKRLDKAFKQMRIKSLA